MTDDEGKVLPECIRNITELRVSEKALSDRVDEFGKQVNRFQEAVVSHSLCIKTIKHDMDTEVLPAIRDLPKTISSEIRRSQMEDPILGPIRKALQEKQDNTIKRLINSEPPNMPVRLSGKLPSWVKTYLVQAIAALLFAAAAAISGYYVAQPSNGKIPVHKVQK